MPIPNQGVVPGGALYNELTSVTRRAFVPRLFVQLYYSTPSLFYMMGNAARASGGLSQITIPVQGASMVQGQWTGYGGGFNSPSIIPAIQNAQFPLCYWVVPVPLPFGESVLQASEREISILKARMNDVYAVTVQNFGSLLFTNNTANPMMPDSFLSAFDAGATVATYGGINRLSSGNAFWKGQYYNGSSLSSGFDREHMSNYIIQITDAAGGEAPDFGIMNPSDYSTLNNDFIGTETIFTRPGNEYGMGTPVRTSFPNLNVAGVPLYADHWCPKGSVYFINNKYTSMYLSEDAAFDFSGFYSLVPLNQIGQQGIMVTGWNLCCAKPVSGGYINGVGGGAF